MSTRRHSDWPDLVWGTLTIDHESTDEDGVVTILPESGSGPCLPLDVAQAGNSGGPMDYSGGFMQNFPMIGFEHCVESDSQSGSRSVPDGSGGHADARDDVTYSRHADTVMKLFTGGKALSKRQNLFMLSATANRMLGMKLKPNLLGVANPQEWELPPVWGPEVGVAPTEIEIDGKEIPANQLMAFGKQVGADGNVWIVQPDNAEPLVGLTAPGKKHYYAGATQGKYYLVSRCSCPRQDLARTTVGVGEVVSIYFSSDALGNNPFVLPATAPIGWTTTAGSLSPASSYCGTVLTSPNSANTADVTATVRGQSLGISFNVIKPSGVQATIRQLESFQSGSVGAGMFINVVVQPTTVSFANILVMEPSEPTIATGYFLTVDPSRISHASHGADDPHPVSCDNLILSPPYNYFDHAWSSGWPIGVSGTYTYPIHPIWWVVGDTSTHSLSGWTDQVMTLSSDGTMRVDKFGLNVTRHP